jgi:hypothetical protein
VHKLHKQEAGAQSRYAFVAELSFMILFQLFAVEGFVKLVEKNV